MKNRIIWSVGTTIALCVCFLLCRFSFFELHGMKQWPLALFVFGMIVIASAAIPNSRKVMVSTVTGYIGGFVLGMIFNTYGVDQGGSRTNNAWQIWAVSYLVIILVGVVWEIINKRVQKKKV